MQSLHKLFDIWLITAFLTQSKKDGAQLLVYLEGVSGVCLF